MIGWTVQVVSDFSPHEEKDAMLAQFSSKPNGGKLLPFGYCAHSIFIRTVKLYHGAGKTAKQIEKLP